MILRTTAQKGQTQVSSSHPDGVRIFAWVRAIRWLGWGFGESLLPVFIMGFSKTFAEAGLFSSTVEIVALISLPIIGFWADKVPAKRLVLWSLVLYPFVGLGYLLAGLFGTAIFIVFARAINGFTWELENIGIATYYRRIVERETIATSFGILDTWTNLAWVAAALIGMYLAFWMPIHYLLFAIAPFSVFAYFIARRAPNDSPASNVEIVSPGLTLLSGREDAGEERHWTLQFWLLGALVFFSSIISSLTTFFIPINAYLDGANLQMVVFISVLGSMPALFGYRIGPIVDKYNRYVLAAVGLTWAAVITIWLGAFNSYWLQISTVFLLGIIVELFSVIQSRLITTLGSAKAFGKRGSLFEGISTLSDLAAPLILGTTLDLFGFSKVTIFVGAVAVLLAVIFAYRRGHESINFGSAVCPKPAD